MKIIQLFLTVLVLFSSQFFYSQQTGRSKITITGKIVEKSSKSVMEYATITFKNTQNPKVIFGGISNKKGEFSIEIDPGTYDVTFEFISFKPQLLNQKSFTERTNLGTISMEEDFNQLNEVIIKTEKTSVEIKLDKKVYNVGSDLTVKGGTVSDVLDNIPSVSVDVDGTVSLRGNENVKILVNGRPSSAINVNDALKMIPADAIEKVEVITNPSARYDAEGGGGILNIILKKGKNKGINGSVIANTGYPENYGLSGTANFKSKEFNLFTTQGYSYKNNPGNAMVNSRYLNEDNSTKDFMNETRKSDRFSSTYNSNFGVDWFLDKSTSWTNTFNYRKSHGNNRDNVFQNYYDADNAYEYTRNRINEENDRSQDVQYTTNLTKNFKREGHKITIDGAFSSVYDNKPASITDVASNSIPMSLDKTINNQTQNKNLFQTDYVLPFGKGSQFEAGYRGSFTTTITDFSVTKNGVPDNNLTNTLQYKEKISALYTQYGTKFNKLSTLFGLRWEDSNIDVNQLKTNDFHNKKYNNFFPSAFFTYEFPNGSSSSINYSRRIQRPNERQLNPFNNLSSNVNIFIGNPNINPSFTDAIDFGYLKRWNKLTFNTSLYVNKTTNVVQFIRKETGDFVNGVPVILTAPINLATELRNGFEFTLNYSPYKWWKINSNFNFFHLKTNGEYTYTDFNGNIILQNFDKTTSSWLTKLSSKISLPYKIDWQTNMSYNGAQKNAQGKTLGIFNMNLAFSKDILKDKGTINLNVSDVFNSKKRKIETYLPGVVSSYAEMQNRMRQINFSFTYRFNMQKSEKEKKPKTNQPENENGDF